VVCVCVCVGGSHEKREEGGENAKVMRVCACVLCVVVGCVCVCEPLYNRGGEKEWENPALVFACMLCVRVCVCACGCVCVRLCVCVCVCVCVCACVVANLYKTLCVNHMCHINILNLF